MPRGISLHIGLDELDFDKHGTYGTLLAGVRDAERLSTLASARGFEERRLLTSEATASRVLGNIEDIAKTLDGGDFFFLTYAGHGTRVTDTSEDELDDMDETWVLYDRVLLDDDLFAAWEQFKPDVRIVVISDSCHSGSVLSLDYRPFPLDCDVPIDPSPERQLLDAVREAAPPVADRPIGAAVLLLSGCQDVEESGENYQGGFFSKAIAEIFDEGFEGNHEELLASAKRRLVAVVGQNPGKYRLGVGYEELEASPALVI